MKRAFTTREKVLLLILVIMVLVLGYFKLILEPINNQIEELNNRALQEQILVDQQQIKLAQMRKMEKLLEEMKQAGTYQEIPAYDNRDAVIVELHQILAKATGYSLDFAGISQQDHIVSRPVSMNFTADSYATARAIIDALHDSENFNIISDVSIQWHPEQERSTVTVALRITYYEVVN